MFTDRILTIGINAELKNNNNGQTKHWSTAHRDKKTMFKALQNGFILYPGDGNIGLPKFQREMMLEPFTQIVDVTVKRILGKGQRLFDPDSITRGNCKQLIDAICDAGILKDDSSRHIGRVLGLQCDQQRERGPYIEISFWKHENESSFSGTGSSFTGDSPFCF